MCLMKFNSAVILERSWFLLRCLYPPGSLLINTQSQWSSSLIGNTHTHTRKCTCVCSRHTHTRAPRSLSDLCGSQSKQCLGPRGAHNPWGFDECSSIRTQCPSMSMLRVQWHGSVPHSLIVPRAQRRVQMSPLGLGCRLTSLSHGINAGSVST